MITSEASDHMTNAGRGVSLNDVFVNFIALLDVITLEQSISKHIVQLMNQCLKR